MKTDRCRRCGQSMLWAWTPDGRTLTLDPKPEMRFVARSAVGSPVRVHEARAFRKHICGG